MKLKTALTLGALLGGCGSNVIKPNSQEIVSEISHSLNFSPLISSENREECNSMPNFLKRFLIERGIVIKYDFERNQERLPQAPTRQELKPIMISFNRFDSSDIQNQNFSNQRPSLYISRNAHCLDQSLLFYIQNKVEASNHEKNLVLYTNLDFNQVLRFDRLIIDHVSFLLSTIDRVGERGRVDEYKFSDRFLEEFSSRLNIIHSIIADLSNLDDQVIVEVSDGRLNMQLILLRTAILDLNNMVEYILKSGETLDVIQAFELAVNVFERELHFSLSNSSYEFVILNAMKSLLMPNYENSSDFREGISPTILEFIKVRYSEFNNLP